jgi:hypothetical protein
MSIILGALGGAGEALENVGATMLKNNLETDRQMQLAQTTNDLELQRQQTLAQFQDTLKNAPLNRLTSKAQELAGQQVPQEAAPVTSLTGSGAVNQDTGEAALGLQGSPAVLRAQVNTWPDGPDKVAALAQINKQIAADTGTNKAAVAGLMRNRTPAEALAAAADDAKVNDLPAYAAYETQIGKPLRDDKRMDILEDRQMAVQDHYARLDATRAQQEAGKDRRFDAGLQLKEKLVTDKAAAASTLTPEMEITAKAIAEGRLPPLTGYAMRSPGASAIMAKVMTLNPTYSGRDYGTTAKAEKDFATGKLGNTVRSFNVALAHLDTLSGLADALDNGDTQLINKIGNAYATQTGGAAPVSFEAAKHMVADEIVKAVTGSAGALGDREAAANTINAASSPEQLRGVIDTYKHLMAGQLDGLRLQYKSTTGKSDFDSKYLGAEAHSLGGSPAPAPVAPAASAAVRISGDDEYNALPSGAMFIGPDGQPRRKP